MDSIATLQPGDQIDNEGLCGLFGCGPQGGMRRSLRTNTLVIICNHVESIYDDRWIDGVLHYTGMGQKGDQSLDFMQNKTLTQSGVNGVAVHLFEVHRSRLYTYVGEVALAAAPYQETQADDGGNSRKVWVFPVAPKSGQLPPIPADLLHELDGRRERQARKLSDEEIAIKARQSGRAKVGVQSTLTKQHQRSIWVAEYAKRRADGHCELCKEPAPFTDKAGKPYLETHHIEWLARGGADTIENTVALCPNCHRKVHVLDQDSDFRRLQSGGTNP
jgi:5-methylcytosine-specific restriction protein A